MDGFTQDAFDIVSSIYGGLGKFTMNDSLRTSNQNLLIINTVGILKQHQRQGFGLQAVHNVINSFKEMCSVSALLPSPMQFSIGKIKEWKNMYISNDFSMDYETGQKYLSLYWQKLGFHYTDDNQILYKNIES